MWDGQTYIKSEAPQKEGDDGTEAKHGEIGAGRFSGIDKNNQTTDAQ